jgi:hypothetical protein
MAAFEATEMDVVVRLKIVTYHPKSVIESQIKIQRHINAAFADAGKLLDFLPAPVSVTISGG